MASRRHGSKRPATSSGNDPAVKSSHAPARSTMTRSLPDNDGRSSNNSRKSYRNSRHKPAVQPQGDFPPNPPAPTPPGSRSSRTRC